MLTMAKPKPNRSRSTGKTRMLNAEIDPKLDDALNKCVAKERRTKKAIISIALEQYLERAELWPPTDDEE